MFDVFGTEMPLAVRFFLAFLIVLGLIGVAAWAVRRFGSARLAGAARGRQPRLAVIDYASVDARRRLILIRRDNVEHLVMVGGPTDVVVESNIVRAAPGARPSSGVEAQPRAIPLPELGSNGSAGSWPLQPEPASPPAPRPQREVLTALADDLVSHPPPPRGRSVPPPRPHPVEQRPEPRIPAQTATAEAPNVADQSLAEMAQRLEAALRKPKATEKPAEAQASPTPGRATTAPAPEETIEAEAASPAPPPPASAPRSARPPEAKPARTEAKPEAKVPSRGKEGKLYETLEQEMASLLGRPPGKSG